MIFRRRSAKAPESPDRRHAATRLVLETLEPRMLLSADPVSAHLGDAASLFPGAPDPEQTVADALEALTARAESVAETEDDSAGVPLGLDAVVPADPSVVDPRESTRELVFVDAGVTEPDRLLADLLRDGGERQVQVVMLDSRRDGVAQVSEALAHYRALDAVHVLSHGTDGAVQLGASVLDQDSLARYADAIRGWSYSLGEQADLLFYGCNLAAGDDGRALVGDIAALTGADVAASEDLTGSAARGGDWELEYQVGAVDAEAAINPSPQRAWLGVLDAAAIGTEFPINSSTSGDQLAQPGLARSVASDAAGNFVVVWESDGQDGDGLGIYGQRFDANGLPQGPEFPVNTEINNDQSNAAVAMNAGGEFIVVWQSDDQDGDGFGIYAQRYDATGATDGPEFRVNSTVAKDQLDPDVTLRDDGSFVVTWSGENQDGDKLGIYAQRYDAAGFALGGEVAVNSWTANDQQWSSLAATPDGGFVVTWSSNDQDGDGYGVFLQRFDAVGNTLDGEMRVNIETAKDQQRSQVDMAADGSFVVVWESDAQDGNGLGIYAQRFLSDGSRDGGEFLVNQTSSKDQMDAAVSMDASGNFVVAWTSDDQDGDGLGVYARQYDSLGGPIAGETQVSTSTVGDQLGPGVTLGEAGRHVVTWGGEGPADDVGVYAQRFLGTPLPLVDLNGGGAGSGFTTIFTEDGGPVLVTDGAAATLGDPDGGNLRTLTVLITNPRDGLDETLDADVSGTSIVKVYAAGVLTLTGPDSLANFQQVLRTVSYDNASQAPTTVDRILRFVPKDLSGLDGASAYATVGVNAVNDAPVIAAPVSDETDEDSTLVFSTATGNAVTVADDARDAPVEVTLAVGDGDLSLSFTSGDEFRVNTTSAGEQLAPAVAVAADGRYVVAWQTKDPVQGWNVHAQLYAADGSALTGEVVVASDNEDETAPAVAIGDDGHFVVAWELKDTNPAKGKDIYAQSFDVTGAALTGTVRLNATTADPQSSPDIAMDADGNVVVAWQSDNQDGDKEGIVVRRFDAALGALTGEVVVNQTTGDAQTAPAIAMTDSGSFVVAWQSKGQDGGGEGIYGRLFDAAASPLSGEFGVNVTTAGDQSAPDVAMDDGGAFVIAWRSDAQDGDQGGIVAQRFDALGAAQGGEIQVNTTTPGDQAAPTVAMADNGHFAVAWQSIGQDDADGKAGVYLREFDPSGTAPRPEIQVNTVTADDQDTPAIAIRGGSDAVVVWHSDQQDGDKGGIYGQRFLRPGAISFSAGDGIDDASMTFTGEVADINRALDGLSYTPRADFWGTDTLNVSVDDLGNTGIGGALGDGASVTLTVNPMNDPIALTIPGAHAVDEDVPIVFSAANGNAITVTDDADDDGSDIELVLSVGQGTLTFATTVGLTFMSGADGDAAMTVRGTPADIRAALDGLTYAPDAHYFGVDTLNVSVDDLGNTGSGGPYAQAGSVAITLASVNDAPSHQLPAVPTTLQNTPLVFSGGGNAITVFDPDAGTDDIEMTLEVDRGTLTLAGTAGLAFSTGDGTADDRMTFRAQVSEINAALDGLRFDPPPGYAGPASLRLVSNDLGNNGPLSIALGDDDVLLIDIMADAVNDAPENTVPGPQSTLEESPLVFSTDAGNGISVNDDAGGNDIEVTLSAVGGTVTLSNTTGGEFQVNSVITDEQREARTAMAPDGSLVVVWQSKNQDSSDFGVYAQRYTPDGTPVGGEFRVNDSVASAQAAPEVAVAADGSFVVAWESDGQDGDKHGVFARRFDATGAPLGPEVQVNAFTGDEQRAPAIASDAAGNFVVTWQSKGQDGSDWGIYAQRFDAAGVAQGPELRVNTTSAKEQSAPAVAMDADGDFVVTWQSEDQDGDAWGIYAQRYDAGGVAQGGEFLVNTITFKEQLAPAVAMDADGDFVVAWQSRDLDYPDDRNGIYVQRFDAAGNFLDGGQRLVNTTTPAEQTSPSVAMDSAGSFVVAWQGQKQDHPDGKEGVIAQRFAADGAVSGGEFLVNTTTAKAQTSPSVSMGDDGRFAVVWTGDGQDGDKLGVFGQRYRDITTLDFVTGVGDADTIVIFRGTLDEINDALDGLVFTPDPDVFGAAQLMVTTDDLGFSGSGGAKSDVDVIDINVLPVNDAPLLAVPGAQTVAQGVPLVFSTAGGNAVALSDSDVGAGVLRVSVDGVGGLVSLGSTAGLTFVVGDGTDDAAMTFTGTLADINAALDGMAWRAPADFAGAGTLHVRVDDQGNIGAGAALTDAAGVSITVVADAVNDAPRIQVPDPQRTDEDEPIELSAALGNGIVVSDDAADNPITVTLNASHGRVTLAHSAGPEDLVNSETAEEQEASRIALAADGGYVVVWQSKNQDGSGYGIFGQRYDAAGLPLGGEFQVNATSAGEQTAPVVAVGAAGHFVVAWVSNGQDGSGEGIFAQRFAADGTALGGEFLVNTDIAGDQSAPSVAVDASGAFVIAWQGDDGAGDGILIQRYDANGVAQGAQTVVNATTTGTQLTPSVAMDAAGNFVVAWQGSDADGKGVFAQRFDAAGATQGPEFRVHTGTGGDQELPSVAMNSSGTFVVAWQGEDADGDGVYVRAFDAGGTALTGNLRANDPAAGDQRAPEVAINDAGKFGVAWEADDGSGKGLFARLFAPDGSTQEGQFRLNTTTAGNQTAAAVAIMGDGTPVATWTSDGQDGDRTGVYAQRLLRDGALSYTTGDGVNDVTVVFTGALADINAALDGLVFTPSSGFAGVAGIKIDVDDGGNTGGGPALTDQDHVDIVVGKAPLVDLDADDSSGADGAGFQATFLVGGGAVSVADAADVLIEDPDDGNLVSVTITLTNPLDGAAEILNANTGGTAITAVPAGSTLTLTGPDTLAHFQQVLRTLTYDNVAGSPTAGVRLIEVVANDGDADGNTAVAAVNVTLPEADAPVEVANTGSTVNEGGVDPIVAAELDHADAQPVESVRYTVTGLPAFGHLELATAPGTPVVSFTQADVDGGLLRYRHDGSETTADSFEFNVNDGLGNVLANRSFTITVAAVNDIPSAADDVYVVDEDTVLVSGNPWFDSGWSDRIRLSFDNATHGEPLVDVPVLVALDGTRIAYASIQNAGQDLRFVDGDGTLLDHEIERWDETGTSYVWVKVPQIDAGSAGDFIWMYYGNSGAADGQNEAGVWSSDYRGVWHLDETSGQHADSTGLTSDLSAAGGVNKDAVGVVGGADEFDGFNEYLWTSGSDGALQITGDVTVQVWTRLDNLPPPNGGGPSDDVALLEFAGFGESTSGNYLYSLIVQSDGQLLLGHESGSGTNHFQDMGVFLNTDRWYHLAAVRDTSANTWTLYVDGVQAGTPYTYASEATGGSAADLYIGWDNEYLDGKVDEPRVAASVRSADWIAAQFAIQSDAFISYGTPEQLAGVLDNDGDADGDTLSAALLSGPSNAASFVLNADGSFSYTPNAHFSGTDSFTYQAYDGTDPSLPATVTITVNPVNDEPSFTTLGDQSVNEDSGPHTVAGFATPAPGGGADESGQSFTFTVSNDNAALFAVGPAIDASGQLTYTLNPNVSGTATVTVSVRDDGGTANGGDDTSPDQTFDIVVAPVNDEPSFTTLGNQNVLPGSGTHSVAGFATPAPGGGADEAGQSFTYTVSSDNAALFAVAPAIDASGTLSYTLNPSVTGSATVTVSARDDGGTANGGDDTSPNQSFNIVVTAFNTAPDGADATRIALEDTVHVFAVGDFGFSDADGHSLQAVRIASLPGAGTLSHGAGVVSVGDVVSKLDIAAGKLVFTPSPDASGAGYASFTFQVQDDGGTASGGVDLDPTPNTIIIDVTAVNDEPSFTTLGNQSVNEDSGPHTVAGFATSAPGGGGDEAGQSFTYTVSNDNAALFAVAPAIDAAGTLTYTLNPNVSGSATVTVSVRDDGGTANGGDDTSPSQAFDIVITPVNDPPSGANTTVTTAQDTGYVFLVSDFGFSDPAEGNALLGVEITTLPGAGLLTNAAVALSLGDTVSAADIAAGRLVFTPVAGANGAAYAGFAFLVQDDGGTANGGLDRDPSAKSLTIDVTPVAAPVVPPADPPPVSNPDPVSDPPPVSEPSPVSDSDPDEARVTPRVGSPVEPDDEQPPADSPSPDPEPPASDPSGELPTAPSDGEVATPLARTPVVLASDIGVVGQPDSTPPTPTSSGPKDGAAIAQAPIQVVPKVEPLLGPSDLETADGERPGFVAIRAGIALALDRVRNSMDEESGVRRFELGQSTGAALGLSVGYVSWLLRGGVLLSSVLSSLPAWRFIDPLPVFSAMRSRRAQDDGEDESLEEIVEGAPDNERAPPSAPADDTAAHTPAAQVTIAEPPFAPASRPTAPGPGP